MGRLWLVSPSALSRGQISSCFGISRRQHGSAPAELPASSPLLLSAATIQYTSIGIQSDPESGWAKNEFLFICKLCPHYWPANQLLDCVLSPYNYIFMSWVNFRVLKAPYSSKKKKKDIFFFNPRKPFFMNGYHNIIKCGIWQPVKFQLISRFWTGS